jgi:hypothetical protein
MICWERRLSYFCLLIRWFPVTMRTWCKRKSVDLWLHLQSIPCREAARAQRRQWILPEQISGITIYLEQICGAPISLGLTWGEQILLEQI